MAVRVYEPPKSESGPIAVLIFYHGGGAYSGSYSFVGQGLAQKYNVKVYTPDLRGHGLSEGPRGDSPSATQVSVSDIDSVLGYVLEERETAKDLPIYLGGHSSGAGLLLNYATATERKTPECLAGYLLVAPQLGVQANVARDDSARRKKPFAKVSIWPFILNGITGTMGHFPAVQFQYPTQALEENDQLVSFNTVNMANAISPTDPKSQLEQMVTDSAVAMWMGADDELFDVAKVTASYFPGCMSVPNATHLGIIIETHELIGPWIHKRWKEGITEE